MLETTALTILIGNPTPNRNEDYREDDGNKPSAVEQQQHAPTMRYRLWHVISIRLTTITHTHKHNHPTPTVATTHVQHHNTGMGSKRTVTAQNGYHPTH